MPPWAAKGNIIRIRHKCAVGSLTPELTRSTCPREAVFLTRATPRASSPPGEAAKTYNLMINAGKYTHRNYFLFRARPFRDLFGWYWRSRGVEA